MRPTPRSTSLSVSVAGLLTALLAGPIAGSAPSAAEGPARAGAPQAASTTAARAPALRVRTLARGLQHAWDVQQAPGGRLVVSERDRARVSVVRDGRRRTLARLAGRVWVSGETGLLSLAVDPASRTLWACHGARTGAGPEVRVTRWRVDRRWRRLAQRQVVVTGIPATSGRHGGCRLLLEREGDGLLVGTGDAAVGTNPRDLDSLAGKVLRVHRRTGAPMPDNPWAGADTDRRLVWTYGHRNVQGLAQRADGSLWSVEHGSFRDDEVNLLVPGGDYGWNPVPGYDESVPMTDQSLPGAQQEAAWSSGEPTVATSGAAWVTGRQWGSLEGTLAVAALKGSEVLFLRFDDAGGLVSVTRPARLQRFGRLRSITSAADGDLLVTTDNGTGDRVLRVSPR
ncbi:sorbosone dehydrogenase family protein [Nocardioides sp. SYSU D00065]|uniref:PQQ-dependent sugar dehydrogenase n=1 Tax=Nocardioides sp. SYSU D00065 TaxID=2817378 RepID=UPI001B33CF7E|nr:PQQ-dependent sugar dehydrogenase [Nocardioides sp. SYSU D00065]